MKNMQKMKNMKNKTGNFYLWLPSIISDNMMIQAGARSAIWGRSCPKEKITIKIAGRSVTTAADNSGNFKAFLPPLKHGGPYVLTINEKMINNVLVGDIWLCSGQSNMEMTVGQSKNAKEELAGARYNKMRFFGVPCESSNTPLEDVLGKWTECTPETAATFSAAGYFFGRKLHNELKIPIGLINASWGGTAIEPWTSLSALKAFDGFASIYKAHRKSLSDNKPRFHTDPGNVGARKGFADEDCSMKGWKNIKAPGYWSGQGLKIVGAVWVRKTVNVPASWIGQDLYLSLSPIVDADTTYFNGNTVGGLGLDIRGAWTMPRKYLIPASMVKAGRNAIAIRIFGRNTNGGFSGPKQVMRLSVINKEKMAIPLHGNWRYKIELALRPRTGFSLGEAPGYIFNAMIYPLTQFALKGFIWYQGESNIGDPPAYQKLFPIMIADWRKHWRNADLPFYFVQLPDYVNNFGDNLARIREAQLKSLAVNNTGMAVIIDGGEKDIHPKNKQIAGDRLALQALAKTYGKKLVYSGPLYRCYGLEAGKLRIYFDHAGEKLKTSDKKPLKGFTIAGRDGVFLPATVVIEKKTVLVWNNKVKTPAAVRYAWSATPECNLVNSADLPASPFRTDCW